MKKKEKFKNFMKSDFFKSILIYTAIFAIAMFVLISIFTKYGKEFLEYNDGVNAHLVYLRYYRDLLINFIRTGNFSLFTWRLGNGIDLFSNYAFFIIGDVFSYLSILVRTRNVEFLYNILIILRVYCVGLSFLCYTKHRKINCISSVIGAILYTFSSFVLCSCMSQPYYINAAIMFPLLLIGIEKIIKEEKVIFYTIMVAFMFLSNFYFAYTFSIILAIYGCLLSFYTYKKNGVKKILKVLFKTLFYSILGILISSIILLPVLFSYSSSDRVKFSSFLIYPFSYYRNFISSIFTFGSPGFWTLIGIQSLILITIPLFLLRNRKDNKPLFFLFLFLLLTLLVPSIGSVFVGFNFPNNRWSFVITFLLSFFSSLVINSNYKMTKKELLFILIGFIVFFASNIFFEITISTFTQIQLLLALLWLFVFYFKDSIEKLYTSHKLYNAIMLLILTISTCFSIKYTYDIEGRNLIEAYKENGEFSEILNTSYHSIPDYQQALNKIKQMDTGFFQIAKKPCIFENMSQLKKYNSIGQFNSILFNEYSQLNSDLDNIQFDVIRGSKEFDYRTKIMSLLGVKYLINYEYNNIPYGYEKVKEYHGESNIYKNKYYLPFGIFYDDYITLDEYNNLSSLEKETSLLKTVALEKKDISNNINHYEIDFKKNIKSIPYKVIDNKNIMKKGSINITTNVDNSFELEIDNIEKKELYISFENLVYHPFSKEELIKIQTEKKIEELEEKEFTKLDYAKIVKNNKWYQKNDKFIFSVQLGNIKKERKMVESTNAYYMNVTDFLYNLGYYNKKSGKIKVTFNNIGTYTFDNIKIYAVSMDDYEKDITKLRKSNFEVMNYDNGYLKGQVNTAKEGILQFQTMYNKGWKVYVDGKKAEVFKCNKYFLGIRVPKGKHKIYMKYHIPYLKEGFIITTISFIIFIVIILKKKKIKVHS